MSNLQSLAALLLLSITPTATEVVMSMSVCAEFLLQQTPPHIQGILEGGIILNQSRYKPICQTLNNMRSFVTLYDTQNKIPVFSASKYIEVRSKGRRKKWRIEPQLERITSNKNMKIDYGKLIYNYQARDTDYTNRQRAFISMLVRID